MMADVDTHLRSSDQVLTGPGELESMQQSILKGFGDLTATGARVGNSASSGLPAIHAPVQLPKAPVQQPLQLTPPKQRQDVEVEIAPTPLVEPSPRGSLTDLLFC